MNTLDIRLPIGGLFTALGLVLAGYGMATNGDAMYARSEGVNINLWWGLIMLVFGVLMLFFGAKAKPLTMKQDVPPPDRPRGH